MDRIVGRYWLYGPLVVLITLLFGLALFTVAGLVGLGLRLILGFIEWPKVAVGIGLAILIVAFVLLVFASLVRLSVLLAGIALDQQPLSPRNAWRHTRKNTCRIYLALLLCTLPSAIVVGLLMFSLFTIEQLSDMEPSVSPSFALFIIFNQIVSLLLNFLGLSALTFAYRFFYEPESLPKQDAAL